MITMKDMSFGYNKGSLFEGLSLDINKGNIYGLLGLNGSGKTSLLRLISGLLFPKGGRIRVLGEDPGRRTPGLLSKIIVLPEELNAPCITDREYAMSRSVFYPEFDHDQFERYLDEFEIPRNKKLNNLSYGQKKKYLLSFGLASRCELFIMDEPTNGLDIPSKVVFRKLAAEALTEDRLFIVSTHQVRDVDTLLDSIIILSDGKILFSHALGDVENRLHMTRTSSPPDENAEGLIFSQSVIAAHLSVWAGANENGTSIDLEVLFNAIMAKSEIINSFLTEKGETV